MDKKTLDTWLPMGVAIVLPLLTVLGNAWVLLIGALVAMLVMAVLYSRTEQPRIPVALAIVGAAVISSAMVVLWLRSSH